MRQIQAAVAHQRAGRLLAAEKIYSRILNAAPGNFDCAYLLAALYAQQGKLRQAIDLFRRAAQIRPQIADVHYNLAVALGMIGDHVEAADAYKRVLELDPRNSAARNNYATSLLNAGQPSAALAQYNELVALHPELADGYNNRGLALQYLKRLDEALADFDKAIALRANFPQANVNRGNVLAALHRPDEALASYNKAIASKPDFADAYSNAGNIYSHRRSYSEALQCYDRALALRDDDSETRSMRLYAKMHLCDWTGFDAECATLVSCIDRDLPTYPFVALALPTTAEQQLRSARLFAAARYPRSEKPLWRGEVFRHERLRIAYVSSDFRAHAVSHLMAGMLECHDKAQFEITAIAIGPDDGSQTRRRIHDAVEGFIDAVALRDEDVAARVRAAEIDILVDLNGYTQGARPAIFAQRAAPLQVGYLGYSGTVGADFIDYVIADATVIPREQSRFYREKVVWLPDSFMVNDASRRVAERTPARSELHLPEAAFVFCCFNQPYKVSPSMFDVWMRLLKAVDGSVLWLKDNGATAKENLYREAARKSIAPERLIFAPPVPLAADHLARHRQADLFLDTLPYNAHATASDALWAGLPVITCAGSTFAGRVAASLLKASGLDELITASLDDYEALALKLARDPGLLGAFRATLERNRDGCALFDTARSTRRIEAAYVAMRERLQHGLAPESFAVEWDH